MVHPSVILFDVPAGARLYGGSDVLRQESGTCAVVSPSRICSWGFGKLWISKIEHESVHGGDTYTGTRMIILMVNRWVCGETDIHVGKSRENSLLVCLEVKTCE